MVTIGIGGRLGDAVFKARVLEGREPRSVHLVLSPFCRPLVTFFEQIPSVASVTVDEEARSHFGHGEHVRWCVPIDVNVEYPGYPDEWCPNYVARHFGGPITTVDQWFGAFSYVLGEVEPFERPTLYYDLCQSPWRERTRARIRSAFPDLAIVVPDFGKPMLENMRLAAACVERLCNFDGGMTLLSPLGLSSIVDLGARAQGVNHALFAVAEAALKRSEEVFDYLTHRLTRRYAGGMSTYRIGRALGCDSWRLQRRRPAAARGVTVCTTHPDNWGPRMVECSLGNKGRYCRRHGYRFVHSTGVSDPAVHPIWENIPMLLRELPSCDWLFWVDANSVVMNGAIKLEEFIDDDFDLILGECEGGAFGRQLLVKNSGWSKQFLEKAVSRCRDGVLTRCGSVDFGELIRFEEESQRHVLVVPNKMFNASRGDSTYETGDFLVHFRRRPHLEELLEWCSMAGD
jgi:hypothetical protein